MAVRYHHASFGYMINPKVRVDTLLAEEENNTVSRVLSTKKNEVILPFLFLPGQIHESQADP